MTRRAPSLWLALAFSAGCFGPAAIPTAYDNADWLLGKEVERRLCPSHERRAAFEVAIDRLHRWHRVKELPKAAALLRRLASALEDGVTRAEFDGVFRDVEASFLRLWRQAARPLVALLAAVEPTEIECIEKTSAEADEQARKDLDKSPAELARDRVTTLKDRLEAFAGEFTASQIDTLTRAFERPATALADELAERARSATAFIDALKRPTEAERRAALRDVLRPSMKPAPTAAREARRDRIWLVVSILSAEQRATLAKAATELADVLDALAKRRP